MTQTKPSSESMGIDPYERNWIRWSIVLLVVFAAAIALAAFGFGFQVPGVEMRVDPRTVTESGPFSQPGLREIGAGEYEAFVVARTFSYEPTKLEIPVGSRVTFYVTSVDVQHGFKIQDTNVNLQVVPGEVSRISATFDQVGEFPIICTEFCGIGHGAMFATIRVVP
jgi:cytochrome c oxidase subunit 2